MCRDRGPLFPRPILFEGNVNCDLMKEAGADNVLFATTGHVVFWLHGLFVAGPENLPDAGHANNHHPWMCSAHPHFVDLARAIRITEQVRQSLEQGSRLWI